MCSPNTPDIVMLSTPSNRYGDYEKLNSSKVYESELCMLALPPDEQGLLMRVSQFLFCHCLVPVVVRTPTEALIHSRYSRFALIVLPDDDPALIRKVRSVDGMNSGTPILVLSSSEHLSDSTLQMLNHQEICGIVQRTTNSGKLETDLIAALTHVIGWSCLRGLSSSNTINMSLHNTSNPAVLAPDQKTDISIGTHGGVIPARPICNKSFSQPGLVDMANVKNTNQVHEEAVKDVNIDDKQAVLQGDIQQQQRGAVLCPVTPVSQEVVQTASVSSTLESSHNHENMEILPGIETLLTAISVVEGEKPVKKAAPSPSQISSVLNFSESSNARGPTRQQAKKVRKVSSEPAINNTDTIMSETELELLQDGKGPMSVLSAKRPYFLSLDQCREPLADDETASPVDRHNAKERHRRVRITKAAEFFKAVIPCMDPHMDKATAFHMTVYYMLFLRNALRRHDPSILPTLHKTYKEEWREVFNMEEVSSDGEKPIAQKCSP